MATLLRLTGSSGKTIIFSLTPELTEDAARDCYLEQTGFEPYESSQTFSFDECTPRELSDFAECGQL
jgi:hypothetical protein